MVLTKLLIVCFQNAFFCDSKGTIWNGYKDLLEIRESDINDDEARGHILIIKEIV